MSRTQEAIVSQAGRTIVTQAVYSVTELLGSMFGDVGHPYPELSISLNSQAEEE